MLFAFKVTFFGGIFFFFVLVSEEKQIFFFFFPKRVPSHYFLSLFPRLSFFTLPLEPFKPVYLNAISTAFLFSGSLGMPRRLPRSVYCVLECVSRWLCAHLTRRLVFRWARGPTDTVYVLNMCGEYLSGADFQLPTPFDVGASQTLACPPPTLSSPPPRQVSLLLNC